MQDSELHTLLIYQARYFEILEEFFVDATGCSYDNFCHPSDFSQAVRTLGHSLRNNPSRTALSLSSFEVLANKLQKFYSEESPNCFKSAKSIKCCKINIGGSSRFLETQLNAVKKTILLSDIVLIPDPVMPWLEVERKHESFGFINLIQSAYFVLQLKDLLSHEFDIPPFLVFPSWEKSLEANDQQTKDDTNQLVADFFSFYVDRDIASIADVYEFVDNEENRFLSLVDENALFISPGGDVGEPLGIALKNYMEEVDQWRTPEFSEALSQASIGRVVLNGIRERVQPQYHLLENSHELSSNPLLCIPAQAHYFSLLSKMDNSRVSQLTTSDPNLQIAIAGLANSRLDYLANINDEQIVELRRSDENVSFRNELRGFVADLPDLGIDELGYAAAEVCSHVESLISAHKKEVDILNGKYEAKHMKTALIAGGGLAVTMIPALAPFLGAALPMALAASGKYTADKLEEVHERKVMSSSMLGVFALAKNQ